jgi:ferredoxin
MAAIMGVKAENVTRKVALVRCSGEKHYDQDGNLLSGARVKAEYEGFHDCHAATKVGGNGPLSCKFGCLGFGNCVKACKYDAMEIVNGVAKVNEDRCTGCMACAEACPRGLIVPVEPDRNVVIACASLAKGVVTTRGCTTGCIGCGSEWPDRFDIKAGMMECVSCRSPESDGIRMPVSPGVLQAMRYICFCASRKIFAFRLPEEAMQQLADVTEAYLTTQLERGFSTLDFYKSLLI